MISKSAKYCLKVILFLAENEADPSKHTLADLAQHLDIPRHFLGKLLQQLSKKQLISSQKGRNGGFYLSREQLRLSPMDYIREMEGEQFMRWCILDQSSCNRDNHCLLHDTYSKLTTAFQSEMSAIRLCNLNESLPVLSHAQSVNTENRKDQPKD